MNINEALIALGEGKIIKCNKINSWVRIIYYKIIDNNSYYFIEEKNGEDSSKDWELSDIIPSNLRYSSISETDPVEEYKKKKLEKNYGTLGFNPKIIDLNIFHEIDESSTKQEKALKFINAVKTLIELKSHPLAVPANDEKQYQYFICFYITILKINNYDQFSFKLSEISPAFNNKIDAQQAIEDIGENRLIEMFKVLQGIYD